MEDSPKFAVFGGGSWATAIVKMLCENLEHVGWYMRNVDAIKHIKKEQHNPNYLSAVEFNTNKLKLSNDINEMVEYADYLIFVIPSAFIHQELEKLKASLGGKVIISAIKGIVPESSLIVGEHFNTFLNVAFDDIGVISGPCHAEEVAQEKLSYLTFASTNSAFCDQMCVALDCGYIKVTPSADIYGTEISAVLKNVYAIAAGMCHSLGYGDNFQAVLVSNAIREIKRFIAAVHPINRDADDSAYLGDLLVTAYSQYSRNRTLGAMLGKGYSVKSALMEMEMVAEGYYATESIFKLNQNYGVEMPILEFAYNVIYGNKNARTQAIDLTKKLN